MPAKKDYHRNARFQLRLDQTTLDALKRKAERLDIPVFVAGIVTFSHDSIASPL